MKYLFIFSIRFGCKNSIDYNFNLKKIIYLFTRSNLASNSNYTVRHFFFHITRVLYHIFLFFFIIITIEIEHEKVL